MILSNLLSKKKNRGRSDPKFQSNLKLLVQLCKKNNEIEKGEKFLTEWSIQKNIHIRRTSLGKRQREGSEFPDLEEQ